VLHLTRLTFTCVKVFCGHSVVLSLKWSASHASDFHLCQGLLWSACVLNIESSKNLLGVFLRTQKPLDDREGDLMSFTIASKMEQCTLVR
jgi:hypothetical protein